MENILSSKQQKILRRTVTYPMIARRSLLASIACFVGIVVGEGASFAVMDIQLVGNSDVIIILMSMVLFAVAIFTFICGKLARSSATYGEIKYIASQYSDGKYSGDMTPLEYCDMFGVEYSMWIINMYLIVPLAMSVILYGVGFYHTAVDYRDAAAAVSASYDAIEKAFSEGPSDDIRVAYKNDPREDSSWHTFTIELDKTDGKALCSVVMYINRQGKIDDVNYKYEFDSTLTNEENVDKACKWFAEIEEVTPTLKDYFEHEETADFRYDMTSKFRQDVIEHAAKNSDYDMDNDDKAGRFRVYEMCSCYDKPAIRINYYYSEY